MTKTLQIAWRIGLHAWDASFWRARRCIVLSEEMDQTKTNLGISADSGVFVEEARRAGGSPD